MALAIRIALSVIYGIDVAIRSSLASNHLRYLVTHPLGVAAVFLPPVRVVFSMRLIRSIFRRGHLARFLFAAAVLVMEGAILVYFYEHKAPGSNIHTLGESVWWSIVTVTTVGYGDYYPVTTAGRITAVAIMFIGILTLAVVTAQVASTFVDQTRRTGPRSPANTDPAPQAPTVDLTDLDRRLARIEALLAQRAPGADEAH